MDLGWRAVPGALHIVGKQMVTDMMIVKNLGDVFSVGDERLRSKDKSLWCAYPQFTDKSWVITSTTTSLRSAKDEAN